MNVSGKSRRSYGSPYSRVLTAFGAAIDMTTASLNPSAASQPVGESFRTGARHGTTGVILYLLAAGTLTYKDAAGVSSAMVFAAPPATGLIVPLPLCLTEITSFTGAGNYVVAYWDD